jgi:hypothetical protein
MREDGRLAEGTTDLTGSAVDQIYVSRVSCYALSAYQTRM